MSIPQNSLGITSSRATLKRYFIPIGIALIALLGFLFFDAFKHEGETPGIFNFNQAPIFSMTASKPVRITIPKMGLDAGITELALNEDKRLQIPMSGGEVGWYKLGPTPGEVGPALMVGHLDWSNRPAAFHNLDLLQPGDKIRVSREDGSVAVFEVKEKASYLQSDFPWDQVYVDTIYPQLRLITCTGEFSRPNSRYSHNLVVYADLVSGE